VPLVTIAVSSYHEIKRLYEGNSDVSSALAHVAIDAVGVGAGMALGAKGGVTIGSFLGLHGAAIGGFLGGVVGGVAGKLAATFGKEARLRGLIARYQDEVQSAALAFRAEERAASARFFQHARELDSGYRVALQKYAGDLKHARRLQTAALRQCEGAVIVAAWTARGVRSRDVRAALRALRHGDREPLARVVSEAERVGATALLRALRKYIAVLYQFETDLVESVRDYDWIVRDANDAGRYAAADILEELSKKAGEIYNAAETLRNDIERELRKLGKPLPATAALGPGK
jgi:hypothetical protein